MFSLPRTAQPLLLSFSVAFSPRSFQRAMVLLIGEIPAMGRRTDPTLSPARIVSFFTTSVRDKPVAARRNRGRTM
ncbi:MAG: hypothetical protein ACYC26_08285, partial [Phycisphaerales bacterium]